MKRIFLSFILVLGACVMQAQGSLTESARAMAGKLGVNLPESFTMSDIANFYETVAGQYAMNMPSKTNASRSVSSSCANSSFTNRVRIPDLSKNYSTTPKYYYVRNLATNLYLHYDRENAAMSFVDTPTEDSKFYFIGGENQVTVGGFFYNVDAKIYDGPELNTWSDKKSTTFFFSVADNGTGVVISDSCVVIDVNYSKGIKNSDIGDIWRYNPENGNLESVSNSNQDDYAIWIVEPVAVVPEMETDTGNGIHLNWYAVRNVATGKYLHYEGADAAMSMVTAPDTCSLFLSMESEEGVKVRSYVAGSSVWCAGVDSWTESGTPFEFVQDGENARFYISNQGEYWRCDENGALCTGEQTDENTLWEFERIENFKEVFGLGGNSELYDYCLDAFTSLLSKYSSGKKIHLYETYIDVVGILCYAVCLSDNYYVDSGDSGNFKTLLNYNRFVEEHTEIPEITDLRAFNKDWVDETAGTAKCLSTNSSSLIVNDVSFDLQEDTVMLSALEKSDYRHTNVWQIWNYANLNTLTNSRIGFVIYNPATKMFVSSVTENGVVKMTPYESEAGFYSVSLKMEEYAPESYYMETYFERYDYEDNFLNLPLSDDASTDGIGVNMLYSSTLPSQIEGIHWYLLPTDAVLNDKIYKHAMDVVNAYPEFLKSNYNLVDDCSFYSSNRPSASAEYTVCNLLDGDCSTVFWTEPASDDDTEKQYIQADFGEENMVTGFYFYMNPNVDTYSNVPVKITVSGGNDENGEFDVLAENIEMSNLLYDIYYFSEVINANGTPYRYLRFTVEGVNIGGNSFSLSEFYIFEDNQVVADAKEELNDFYGANCLDEEIVAPAAVLMKRKAEYLLEINKDNHAVEPAEGQYATDKYLALQAAVDAFDKNDNEKINSLLVALEEFVASLNNPAAFAGLCILESAWEEGPANEQALGVDFNTGEMVFKEADIWDISQWFRMEKPNGESNPFIADLLVYAGQVRMNVNIDVIPDWNNLYPGGRYAYTVSTVGDNYCIAVGEESDGTLIVTESDFPVTTTSNMNAAWYLTPVTTEPVDIGYIYDEGLVVYLAEFGKVMAKAKRCNDGFDKGMFVYQPSDGLTKEGFDELYSRLSVYYDMGPVEVVKIYQSGELTEEIAEQLVNDITEIQKHIPNFYFLNGYFRLSSRISGDYLVSEPDGTFSVEPADASNTEKSIYYLQLCEDMMNVNVLSYNDGRYLYVGDDALKYDRIPQHGSDYAFQTAFASMFNGTLGLNNIYLYDNKASVGVSADFSNSIRYKWDFEYVYELPVTISSAKFATFYAPVELQIPEGVTAYVLYEESEAAVGFDYNLSTGGLIDKEGNVFRVKAINGNVLPAATPVLLQAKTAGTYYFKINYVPTLADEDAKRATYSGEDEEITNLLEGYHEATYISERTGYTHYILANKSYGIGMYKVNTYDSHTGKDGVETAFATPSFLNNAHRAWLPMPNSISKSAYWYVFSLGGASDGTTGIDEVKGEDGKVKGESGKVKVIYDLQGRRLTAITSPGVYIVNGERVFVK